VFQLFKGQKTSLTTNVTAIFLVKKNSSIEKKIAGLKAKLFSVQSMGSLVPKKTPSSKESSPKKKRVK